LDEQVTDHQDLRFYELFILASPTFKPHLGFIWFVLHVVVMAIVLKIVVPAMVKKI